MRGIFFLSFKRHLWLIGELAGGMFMIGGKSLELQNLRTEPHRRYLCRILFIQINRSRYTCVYVHVPSYIPIAQIASRLCMSIEFSCNT